MRNRWWAAPLLAGGVAVLAACGSSASPSANTGGGGATGATSPSTTQAGSSSGTVIKTGSTSKGTVLVNAQGKTLYWFAIDTPTKSNCTSATCLSFWPPVIGKPSAASGTSLTMALGTIKRSDGKVQATYGGHPLYTFSGDSGPGSIKGNDFNASGGLWWAMTPSGAKLGTSAAPSSTTSSAGSGGYY
jgi:predicted lipoprotein with Yx(FWY)xxD motif